MYGNFTAQSTHIDVPLARSAASPEPHILPLNARRQQTTTRIVGRLRLRVLHDATQDANQAAVRVVVQMDVVAARGSDTGERACEHVVRLDVRFAARSGGGGTTESARGAQRASCGRVRA